MSRFFRNVPNYSVFHAKRYMMQSKATSLTQEASLFGSTEVGQERFQMVSRALELYSLPVRFYAVSYEKKRKPSRMSREMLHLLNNCCSVAKSYPILFFFFRMTAFLYKIFTCLKFWPKKVRLESPGPTGLCIFIFYLFFTIIFISWRLITLQYCGGFCHTLT